MNPRIGSYAVVYYRYQIVWGRHLSARGYFYTTGLRRFGNLSIILIWFSYRMYKKDLFFCVYLI